MKDITKYQGVIPAFYACYDAEGNISTEGVKALTRHLIAKGVKGVYVGGSSGECIYQHVDERKAVLEAVMSEAKGKLTVIAHVGCNNTADSVELARHAESVGVDAIASIPPIYFHLPEYAIAKYWNDMSAAAPNTEFVIYNIPQLAGTGLTMSLLREMLKNPNVVAVKNSSMPTQDIQMFKDAGIAARGEGNFVVFNGPDEQFVSGRVIGADGGIGGTYAVMPELYLAMNEHINKGEIEAARAIQAQRYAAPGYEDVRCNAQLTAGQVRRICRMTPAAEQLLRASYETLGLSARAHDRILRVARTIADLSGKRLLDEDSLLEALQYRAQEKVDLTF